MTDLPEELKQLRQWSYSYSKEELKRPRHTKYLPNGGLTYDQAVERAKEDLYTGLYVTSADNYVLLDVDHISDTANPFSELPVPFAHFLRSNPTYSEVSPSGKGLRIICKLPSVKDKELVDGNTFYIAEPLNDKREIQCNFGPPWMTITGNTTSFSSEEVAEVTLNDLSEIFAIRYKQDSYEAVKKEKIDVTKLPSLAEVTEVLMSIPLNRDPRVQRAYTKVVGQSYAHYDFWVRVLMALHNYATIVGKEIECLELALKWSRTDKNSFESDDDVLKHWRSFSEKKTKVSYKTLFGIAYGYRLFWPIPKKQSKAEKDKKVPLKPLITEYKNFESLINYYNIRIYRDAGEPNIVYLTGDEDILSKYFIMYNVNFHFDKYLGPFVIDTLLPAFHILCQDYSFTGISHNQIKTFIKNVLALTRETVDLVKMYFDTPYDGLPESYREDECYIDNTDFEFLFSSLDIDFATPDRNRELELYKAYYRKWLMGVIRNMYYRDHKQMNNCVLLLTGREQIRKTSHFKFLFPPFLRHKIAFTTHGFKTETAMRDVAKLSATNLLLVWDELEQYLDSDTEPHFKKIIDGNPQKIIDKYEVVEKTIKPIAIYGATSNYREFKLGAEGSRRLFHIPVKWVNTDRMMRVCWHKLFSDLKAEVEWNLKTGTVPWLLTEEQLEYQSILHGSLRSKTNLDMMLDEVFEFEGDCEIVTGGYIHGVASMQTDKSGRLMSTREVSETLSKAGFNMTMVKRPALVRTLERMCGEYTRTKRKRKHLTKPRCDVFKGLAVQGPFKKWVLPPMRRGALAGVFKNM